MYQCLRFPLDAWWFVKNLLYLPKKQRIMNRNRFLELEAEIKGIIGESFAKAIKKRPSDFVLLMARGGYHKHLDRPDLDLTPFVLEDRVDFLMDLTRKKFFVIYLNNYVDRLNNKITLNGDDLEYEMNIQMMIYCHIWESHLFLNQLERLAFIQQGKEYLWISETPFNSKKNFINHKIIDRFVKTDKNMVNLIKSCYLEDLRHAFAHSTYFINGNRIYANENGLFEGKSISFDYWDDIFVRSVLLSYHLNDMLLEIKNHYIEDAGDSPVEINMPMKNNHKERRGVLIKPEPYEGKEEKVRFRFMTKEEM